MTDTDIESDYSNSDEKKSKIESNSIKRAEKRKKQKKKRKSTKRFPRSNSFTSTQNRSPRFLFSPEKVDSDSEKKNKIEKR